MIGRDAGGYIPGGLFAAETGGVAIDALAAGVRGAHLVQAIGVAA